MIEEILHKCALINNGRDCRDVLCSVAEEVGELGKEVRSRYGPSYKVAGPDGILGEAVDVIICAVDMIYIDNPKITLEDIYEVIENKLNKWSNKEEGK